MKKILYLFCLLFLASSLHAQVFISEFHYDNTGGDVGEGVEITGPAGTDLTGWYIQPYNGGNSQTYTPTGAFSGTIPNEGSGFGSVFVAVVLQNGGPDAMALINNLGVVVEFLSYEGSFTATNGPASGMTSTDVGVSEPGTAPIGSSLQLTDLGWIYSPGSNSFGTINTGLTVGGPPTPTMSATPTTFTGLNYEVTMGASASQSGIITASNLEALSTVTGVGAGAISSFEFSIDNVNWTTAFPGPLPGAALNTTPLTVYVRLVSGLAVGTYNATVTVTNTGGTQNAAPVLLSFTGEVTPPVPDIIINEFQSDPDASLGDANGDGVVSTTNDEFIELYNNEATLVDISGWTISDGNGVQHTFPAATVIPAGGFMTVFGGGSPGSYTGVGGQFMPASPSGLSLNNGGDDIILSTGSGTVVASHTYTGTSGDNQSQGRDPDFTGSFVLHSGIVATGRLFSPGAVNVTPPSSCSITAITAGTPSACAPATNTYSVDITVTYSSPPATGGLEVNGQAFTVTTSPQTVTLTGLAATGAAVDITAVFTDDGTCTLTETALYTAPSPCTPPIPACSDLFFSEYIEGSGSNKCLEIFNPTASDIDMAAGTYSIELYSNGATAATTIYPLSGVVPAYGTFVICNPSADPTFLALADETGAATFYNGDDAVALLKAGTYIDVIGLIGEDPGTNWSNGGVATSEFTLIRNAAVQAGDNVEVNPFDPSAEWTALPQNDLSNLGQHNSDCAPFVWTGITSTDFHTASNWTKGTVPGAGSHVWIPSSSLGGTPVASADVTLTDLTVRAGASLNISPTFGLTFSGTANVDGIVTLESSALGTAWLDDFSTLAATYNGDLTVQTFVTAGSGLGQRYFGSPVVNGVVSGLDATYASGYPLGPITPLPSCDPTQLALGSAYSNLFQWNENTSFSIVPTCLQEGWEAISASSVLTPGRGYSGWMNDGSIISFTGAPNTGDVSYVTTGISAPAVPGANGWHVLSNPFPSPIDAVAATLFSGFSSVQVYNGASGPYSGSFLPALIAGPLPIMQGFVAEATLPGSQIYDALGTFRIPANHVWQKPEFGHMLTIDVLGNGTADQSFVYFNHEATEQFDIAGDCKKFESNAGYPTLFTNNNGQRMSLNGYPDSDMTRSVDLGLEPGSNGTFTFSFEGLSTFPTTSLIFLEDKETGDFVNIREVAAYSFDMNMGDNPDRFVLHFTAPIEITSTSTSCEGYDATVNIDFGQNVINNQPIAWDYSLEQNTNVVITSAAQSGNLSIANLDKGNYTLELQNGNYTIEILVEIDGVDRVNADFEDPMTVEEGTLVHLSNLSTGSVLNAWSVEGESYMTQDLVHSFTTPGLKEIRLDASNADCSASAVKTVEVTAKSTGIKDAPELEAARVYGAGDQLIIDMSSLATVEGYTARVFNLLGQEIESVELTNSITKINVKESGNYFLIQLVQGQTQKVFKVLVK